MEAGLICLEHSSEIIEEKLIQTPLNQCKVYVYVFCILLLFSRGGGGLSVLVCLDNIKRGSL